MKLTENELSIMEVLWNENRALNSKEIVNLCTDKHWKSSSIHILINSLLDKGAIKVAGFERVGRTYSRTFVPTFERDSFVVNSIIDHVQLSDSIIRETTAAFINDEHISNETLSILEKLIADKKNSLNNKH